MLNELHLTFSIYYLMCGKFTICNIQFAIKKRDNARLRFSSFIGWRKEWN